MVTFHSYVSLPEGKLDGLKSPMTTMWPREKSDLVLGSCTLTPRWEDRFRSIIRSYYRGAAGMLLVPLACFHQRCTWHPKFRRLGQVYDISQQRAQLGGWGSNAAELYPMLAISNNVYLVARREPRSLGYPYSKKIFRIQWRAVWSYERSFPTD